MTNEESLKGIEQDVQIEERTKLAMETYVNWLQTAMSASPWANVDLNKKLLSYATDNVTAGVGLVQKLSQAKTVEDVVKIQTEFMSQQLNSFNEQTKTMVEMCTKAAQDMTKGSRACSAPIESGILMRRRMGESMVIDSLLGAGQCRGLIPETCVSE